MFGSLTKSWYTKMAEITIPEFTEVLSRLTQIERGIGNLQELLTNIPDTTEQEWYSRPAFRAAFRIGNEKLNELVEKRYVECDESRGRRGLMYRWIGKRKLNTEKKQNKET